MTSRTRARSADPDVATIASAIGDPVRSAMLLALLDGRPRFASDLAADAGASPQAASGHLARLLAAGLVVREADGRRRRYALASNEVAHAIEALAVIAPRRPIVALRQSLAVSRMRDARSCYDHLADRFAVAFVDRLVARRVVRLADDGFAVTRSGERFFATLGVNVANARAKRRSFANACLDLTERRPHLAGSLGAALLDRFLDERWFERNDADRALRVTERGRDAFAREFGIVIDAANASAARP